MAQVLRPLLPVGKEVLFLWKEHAFTGRIREITDKSYGVLLDDPDTHYMTDMLQLERCGNLVYPRHQNTLGTGQIVKEHFQGNLLYDYKRHHFVSTYEAYRMLPKYSVNPYSFSFIWDDDPEGYKKVAATTYVFSPNRTIVKFKNDPRLYLYVVINDNHFFRSDDGMYISVIATIGNMITDAGILTNTIDKVWNILDGVYAIHLDEIMETGKYDVVYNEDGEIMAPTSMTWFKKPKDIVKEQYGLRAPIVFYDDADQIRENMSKRDMTTNVIKDL